MSRLAVRAETIKLAQILHEEAQALTFLQAIPAQDLRTLRRALEEFLFKQYLQSARRVAQRLRWLPRALIAFLMLRVLGPRISTRVGAELPVRVVARVAPYLPRSFLADGARFVEPRRMRAAIGHVPMETSVRILRALLERRDYITLGRFVEHLPDEFIRAIEPDIDDEAALVEIAFYMESSSRVQHFLRLMPRERVRKAVLLLQDGSRRSLWPKVMLMLTNIGLDLQRELVELAANRDEAAFNATTLAIHAEELFGDVLPLVNALAPQTLARICRHSALKVPGVIESSVRAADQENLWDAQLAIVRWLDDQQRQRVAALLEQMPDGALERALQAAIVGELWEPLLDLVGRMSGPRQQKFAETLRRYGAVDALLLERVAREAANYGLEHLFEPKTAP